MGNCRRYEFDLSSNVTHPDGVSALRAGPAARPVGGRLMRDYWIGLWVWNQALPFPRSEGTPPGQLAQRQVGKRGPAPNLSHSGVRLPARAWRGGWR